MKLAMSVVCDRVRWEIVLRSVVLSTLGGGGSTLCCTLYLVRHATGSYFSLVDGYLGVDGDALGVWMTTLVSKAWGWTVFGQRIGNITELHCV